MAKTIRSSGHEALCGALIEARRSAGLTQEQLAIKLKCHQSLVARIESGQRRIDVIELIVICRAVGSDSVEVLRDAEHATSGSHRL